MTAGSSWPGGMSTGMPRPLSATWTAPSASSVDLDAVAEAGQRLVDGVVHDLLHQVVQAALAGGADVHAGTLADGLEALEHLDRAGVVVAGLDRVALEDAGRDRRRRARPGARRGPVRSRSVLRGGFGRVVVARRPRKASSSAVRPVLEGGETDGACTSVQHNGRLARVGDQAQSTRHTRTITPPARGMWGSGPKICPSEARNRPDSLSQGVGGLPIRARGRSGPHPRAAAARTRLTRRCPWAPGP